MPSLSVIVLDDLRVCYREHREYQTVDEFNKVFNQFWSSACFHDPSGCFETESSGHVVRSLVKDKYCVFNRYNKYYVIAFAIDFQRFHVWSKDCEAKLVDWGEEHNSKGHVTDNLDPAYNVNPVVKFLQMK